MRKSKDDDYRDLKREAKRENIEIISTKYTRDRPSDVPGGLRGHFDIIQRLGRMTCSDYVASEHPDAPYTDCKHGNIIKASQLSELAAKCRRELHNEAGWRMEIEPRLFERFDVDVACKRCRKRLWRSMIEVDPDSSNSRTTSLRDRQKNRAACTCKPLERNTEYPSVESGLSNLFSSRLDQPCHAPDTSSYDPKKRPDRVHGLRLTTNFETHLQSMYAHDDLPQERLIQDVIKTSLYRDDGGEPLLFPFLVLEAKRERCADNFEQMELQTCFPIQHALQLQWDLLNTPGNIFGIPGGPLVWFFANRGEDCRVYAAHVELKDGRPKYFINYLWGGSTTGQDEALQLLLIIDHVVDWARDTFRPNILRQLKSLAHETVDDTATVDPDVLSLIREVPDWLEGLDSGEAEENYRTPGVPSADAIPDPLDVFSTAHGVVKDARRIESRIKGLLITRANLETLLETFKSETQIRWFARQIITRLERTCIVLEGDDVLDVVEELWTGHSPVSLLPFNGKSSIYAQFLVSFYINSVWEPVREITYLAVSEDALELLITRAAYKRKVMEKAAPSCSKKRLTVALDKLRQNSVQHDLMSALCRRTYRLAFEEPRMIIRVDENNTVQEVQESWVMFEQDQDGNHPGLLMERAVHQVFESHRIGNREPSEPCLRASKRIDFEGRALWDDWNEPGDCFDPLQRRPNKILVYSNVPSVRHLQDSARRKYCLYMMDSQGGNLTQFSIVSKLVWTLHSAEIYSTVRRLRGPGPASIKTWRDNQGECRFSFRVSNAEMSLKLSQDQFRREVCDWIKALALPVSGGSRELDRSLRSWHFSPDAVSALERSVVSTIYEEDSMDEDVAVWDVVLCTPPGRHAAARDIVSHVLF